MSINLGQPGRFRRVLIFAMIYEGAPNWAAVDGVVTLTPANGQPVEVRLDDTGAASRMCAVAQLVESGGDLVFQREVQYIDGGQVALDKAFGWGMNWCGRGPQRSTTRPPVTGRTPSRRCPPRSTASRTAARSLASKLPSAPPMMMPICMHGPGLLGLGAQLSDRRDRLDLAELEIAGQFGAVPVELLLQLLRREYRQDLVAADQRRGLGLFGRIDRPSAAAINAHIAMLPLANSLFLN